MDYARWARRLEWAVAAAVMGVHLLIFLWPENVSRPNLLVTSVHDAQHLSGIVLVVAWAILGPGWLRVRLVALPVLAILWFQPWNTRMIPRDVRGEFLQHIWWVAAISIVAIRLSGLRISRPAIAGAAERGSQFSLRALLVSTTLIASLVGVLEWLRPALVADQGASLFANVIDNWEFRRIATTSEPPLNPLLARHLVMASSVVAAALGGLWIMLRPGAIWLRLAVVGLLIPTSGLYLTHLSGEASKSYVGLSGATLFFPFATSLAFGLAAVAALSGLSFLPLRLMDYRLQRQPKVAAAATTQETERRRVVGRAAALVGLLVVVSGSVVAIRILESRNGVGVDPPAKAFAEWIEQTTWSSNLSIIITGGQYVHPQRPFDGDLKSAHRNADTQGTQNSIESGGMF